tara:strand:+ start:433 stop:696 length:264 start_codon:yes stop_codon:yes gene_type:complete
MSGKGFYEISKSLSLSQDGYPIRQEFKFRYNHYEIGILLLWDTTTVIVSHSSKGFSVSTVCRLTDIESAKAIAKKMIRKNWSLLNHG